MVAPNRSAAWANLGDVFAQQGNIQSAVSCYANTLRFSRNPANTISFFRRMNETEADNNLMAARNKFLEMVINREQVPPSPPPPPATPISRPTINSDNGWHALWDDDIYAHITKEPCPLKELADQGYTYFNFVDIPLSRLKNRSHAWVVKAGRAVTVTGCWYTKEGPVLHTVMHRKKDNKTWEQDLNVEDGSWIANP